MSAITIPVRYPDMPRLEHGVHVEITPDLARQIVALAQGERDEARAEVARLKARRVKLPAMQDVEGVSWYAAGHNAAIAACAAALREAGVEVE